MSDDREIFQKRVKEIWDDAMKSCGGYFEVAQHNFSEWIDDELHKLKPSQYTEFIEVAKKNGAYVPGEEREHWSVDFTKDELENMGFGE